MVRLLSIAVLSALAAACGGLDNRPLTTGVVTGRAAECDATGVIGVVGDSSVRVKPDSSCAFRIDGLPPGPVELFVSPASTLAVLAQVDVEAAAVRDAGVVTALTGAFARIKVSAAGRVDFEGSVRAPDLPLDTVPMGRSGQTRVGPFPAGCFRLEVDVTGLGEKVVSRCLAEGEEADVLVEL